jgi:hypothetical protein
MTAPRKQVLVIEEYTTPEQVEVALTDLTNRYYALPLPKQAFLAQTIATNPPIEPEVIALIILMLENSDDDFNITSPELNQLIAEANEAHDRQETE